MMGTLPHAIDNIYGSIRILSMPMLNMNTTVALPIANCSLVSDEFPTMVVLTATKVHLLYTDMTVKTFLPIQVAGWPR